MKRLRPWWLGLAAGGGWALLLAASPLYALDPAKSVSQFQCQTWTRGEGLPANWISAIDQTADGFLWLGTQNGLIRYDGREFKPLELPNLPLFRRQVISALAAAQDGTLWFGINDGAFGGYHPDTGFTSLKDQPWLNPTMHALSLQESSDGAIWFGAGSGVARWAGGQARLWNELPNVMVIYEDSHRRVWLGTSGRGLHYWQAGKLHHLEDGALDALNVMAIAEDRQGQIWVGTQAGLRCYDTSLHPKEIPTLYPQVGALLVDSQGVLWIGTSGQGLLRWQNGDYAHFDKAQGLVHDYVTTLFEDREGSLWIGTRNGLSQLTDVKFPLLTEAAGLASSMSHSVCASAKGGLWIATSSGFSYFNGSNASNFSVEAGLENAYVKRVFEARNGDLFLITGSRQIEVFSQGRVVAHFSHQNEWPTGLAEDAQGVVAAFAGALFRVSQSGMTPFTYATAPPPFSWIRNLQGCRDGALLVASVNGAFRIKDGVWQQWSVQQGLPDYSVHWLHEDPAGTIWAGTTLGIARIRGSEVRPITRDNGLFDNFINSIVPDNRGWVWVQSSRGIFRVPLDQLNQFADGRIHHIDCIAHDGLESVKTIDTAEVEYSGCLTADGRIWFPSPQGVIQIDPAHLPVNRVAPLARIQSSRVNGLEFKERPFPTPRPGNGELEFQYTAASFIAPQKVRFRYRLEGYESEWVDAGTRRSAFYTNLKPGDYRFRVQACNADGLWELEGDSFAVGLPPHFYQNAWFQGLCLCGGLGAIVGVVALRLRHIERKQRQLEAANELLEAKIRTRTAELVEASRKAGMAEVATSVLHNVGNVLNSVNVSATLVRDKVKQSRADGVQKVLNLLRSNRDQPGASPPEKTDQVIAYLESLTRGLAAEKQVLLGEIDCLTHNVDHIKEIVAKQQAYARAAGVAEQVRVAELVEDALRIQSPARRRHEVNLVREFADLPPITVDRHRAMEILVNLLSNAYEAVAQNPPGHRTIITRIGPAGPDRVKIEVADNGVGIAPENLTRIFVHGFTTRQHGHGYGLHSAALAADEMGGSLRAQSPGLGQGATFVLELPVEFKG